jgi:hypothetical protein
MSSLARYQEVPILTNQTRPIARTEQLTKVAMAATTGLHQFALREVTSTLHQAAQLLPATMTEAQKLEYRTTTVRYLATIKELGYSACVQIGATLDEMLRLQSGK